MMAQSATTPIAPTSTRKAFQYSGHYREEYNYSSFHKNLDFAFKHFYSRSNLAAIALDKGWLDESSLHRLDTAVVDVWALVVYVKIPAQIPYRRTISRFVSKNDFLQAAIARASAEGQKATAANARKNPASLLVKSSKSDKRYSLTPTHSCCSCDCPAYQSLEVAVSEDWKLRSLLQSDPVLQGQLPDKHVFSLWATWGVGSFVQYQQQYFVWARANKETAKWKAACKEHGIGLDQTIPGHFDVRHKGKKLGTVDRKFDSGNSSYWINQRQASRYSSAPGDRKQYSTQWEAAIALAQLCQVINDGERVKADLFGGGWDEPLSQHLVEQHADFIDEINQEVQPVAVSSGKKAQRDPFGGFNF